MGLERFLNEAVMVYIVINKINISSNFFDKFFYL